MTRARASAWSLHTTTSPSTGCSIVVERLGALVLERAHHQAARQQLLNRLGRRSFGHALDGELLVDADQRVDDVEHERPASAAASGGSSSRDAGEGRRDHDHIRAAHRRLIFRRRSPASSSPAARRRAFGAARRHRPRAAPGASRCTTARRTWRSAARDPALPGPVPPRIAMRPMSVSPRRGTSAARRSRRCPPASPVRRFITRASRRVTPGSSRDAVWHTRDAAMRLITAHKILIASAVAFFRFFAVCRAAQLRGYRRVCRSRQRLFGARRRGRLRRSICAACVRRRGRS